MTDILVSTILELIGGIGVFLLGMHFMSEGLQTVAGSSLKKLIAAFTSNRIMGIGVGMLVTGILQSSAITTVMVVGFINSGFMTLAQGVGVIMGSNIGTTMTAWIMTLNIGKHGVLLVGAASIFFVFSKREAIKYAALAFLGVGMVFMGLEIMKNGLLPLSQIPEFTAWFQVFSADTYLGVLKCAAVGCILTVAVQSSSVTVGITLAMATQGLITYETAAALVLGENVGSTITALLASIGSNINAKRAAYFHSLFNLSGVVWISLIFQWYVVLIEWICVNFLGIADIRAVVMKDGFATHPNLAVAIATVHSVFNIANTIMFIPLAGFAVKFLERFVHDNKLKPQKNVLELELGEHLLDSPIAAIQHTEKEMVRATNGIKLVMDDLYAALSDHEVRARKSQEIFNAETRMDQLQDELTNYLTRLLGQRVSASIAAKAERQRRLVDNLESITDYTTQILKLQLRLDQNLVSFSADQQADIENLHQAVSSMLPLFARFINNTHDGSLFKELTQAGQDVNVIVRDLRSKHWNTLAQGENNPLATTAFSDSLVAYRRIKKHIVTGAEIYAGLR